MNDYLNIAALAASVAWATTPWVCVARRAPWGGWRTAAALISTFVASLGSMEVGCRLSDLRGPWMVEPGYSCGEAKILGLILIIGAVFLIRAVWQSIREEGGAAARASKLALACLGLFLAGFTLSESDRAHDRFHQLQHQSEARR